MVVGTQERKICEEKTLSSLAPTLGWGKKQPRSLRAGVCYLLHVLTLIWSSASLSDRTRVFNACLLFAGANVILACRSIEKCRKTRRELVLATKNKSIVCEQLDLSSLESVREFAARINASELSLASP